MARAQPVPPTCDPASVAPAMALRVIVQFREPVAGDAPQTLRQLQTLSQGCVWPVSSVSPVTGSSTADRSTRSIPE